MAQLVSVKSFLIRYSRCLQVFHSPKSINCKNKQSEKLNFFFQKPNFIIKSSFEFMHGYKIENEVFFSLYLLLPCCQSKSLTLRYL